ncbi:MAG: ribonuclease Z [Bacteroidales bacterium]
MTTFNLKILGCGSALPTMRHNPSSQVLNINEKLFLIDCGEGTQIQLRKFHVRFQRIEHIFISHLHGDHFFGLVGLISTFHLLGRSKDLHIYGDANLEQIIRVQLKASQTYLRYNLIFHPLKPKESQVLYDDELLTICAFPLSHRIPTWGFSFREKEKLRNINRDFIIEKDISVEDILKIKAGADYIDEFGVLFPNNKITRTPIPPRSFAYVSDTKYFEPVVDYVRKVDLLYHEATFDASRTVDAKDKFHSTSVDAATIAMKAEVGKLIIGHFSARYKDSNQLIQEGAEVFPNIEGAIEGKEFTV